MFYYEKMRMRVVKMLKKMQMFWRVPCFGCALQQLAIKVIYLTLRPPSKRSNARRKCPMRQNARCNAKKDDLQKLLFIPVPPSSQLHSLPPTTTIIVAILIQTDMVL